MALFFNFLIYLFNVYFIELPLQARHCARPEDVALNKTNVSLCSSCPKSCGEDSC